jgi:16S rRNA (guanine527-N7)-methyltransferase
MVSSAPTPPSGDTIRRSLSEFQISANDQQVAQIQRYIQMLLAWNDKINLTAIQDPLEILYRHFCESMYAVIKMPLEHGRLADIGSGGGFPGLPLKILCPGLEIFLVESNARKGTFIAEVIRTIGLKGARVLVSRYEELSEELTPVDFVCSRAVGEYEPFLAWAASDKVAAAKAILWIGAGDLDRVRKIGSWEWQDPIPIPHSLRRVILPGSRKIEESNVEKAKDRNSGGF